MTTPPLPGLCRLFLLAFRTAFAQRLEVPLIFSAVVYDSLPSALLGDALGAFRSPAPRLRLDAIEHCATLSQHSCQVSQEIKKVLSTVGSLCLPMSLSSLRRFCKHVAMAGRVVSELSRSRSSSRGFARAVNLLAMCAGSRFALAFSNASRLRGSAQTLCAEKSPRPPTAPSSKGRVALGWAPREAWPPELAPATWPALRLSDPPPPNLPPASAGRLWPQFLQNRAVAGLRVPQLGQ